MSGFPYYIMPAKDLVIIGFIQILIEGGADVNFNGTTKTALDGAINYGNEEALRLLIEHGPCPSQLRNYVECYQFLQSSRFVMAPFAGSDRERQCGTLKVARRAANASTRRCREGRQFCSRAPDRPWSRSYYKSATLGHGGSNQGR
jgi:hypothetical protein